MHRTSLHACGALSVQDRCTCVHAIRVPSTMHVSDKNRRMLLQVPSILCVYTSDCIRGKISAWKRVSMLARFHARGCFNAHTLACLATLYPELVCIAWLACLHGAGVCVPVNPCLSVRAARTHIHACHAGARLMLRGKGCWSVPAGCTATNRFHPTPWNRHNCHLIAAPAPPG